jgi:hypothetical protein
MERKVRCPGFLLAKPAKSIAMLSNPIGKAMSKAQDSAKTTEEIAQDAAKADANLRTLQQSQKTLDENEEWIARNSGKFISK